MRKKLKVIDGRAAALLAICDALGLLQAGYFERKKERWLRTGAVTLKEIEDAISDRDQARKAKNWQEADRIRNELQSKGIVLEDMPGGTLWKVK